MKLYTNLLSLMRISQKLTKPSYEREIFFSFSLIGFHIIPKNLDCSIKALKTHLLLYLESVYKLRFSKKGVIPAKAGIQSFQGPLDAGSGPA